MILPQGYPAPGYPVPRPIAPVRQQPPQAVRQPAPVATRQPSPAKLAMPAPPPVVRGQSPEPERRNIAMPSPEELGVRSQTPRPATTGASEWTQLLHRLDEMGITDFQLESRADGVRMVCIVGTMEGPRRIEATAATKAEAARQILARLEGQLSN